jgi:hypothetical protein
MLRLPEKDPMPINALARALDKNVATIYRWGSPHGVRKQRLRLTRIGGRTYVEHSNWEAFRNALNSGREPQPIAVNSGEQYQENGIDVALDAAGF